MTNLIVRDQRQQMLILTTTILHYGGDKRVLWGLSSIEFCYDSVSPDSY